LSLDPNLAEARAARARALMGDGLEAQALQEVELALSLDAESQDVLNAAARILFQIGRIAEATAHFERLAELSPGDYGIAIMLLTCYRVTGNAQQLKHAATIDLERAEKVVALEPDNGSAMGCIVLCLTTLGENERAREWMERGVLLDPDNMNMRYNFACILISDLHDLDAGLDLLEPLTKVFLRPSLNWIKNDPDMDRVRNHPRYIAIMGEAEKRLAV
jgi:adenylate cyclase